MFFQFNGAVAIILKIWIRGNIYFLIFPVSTVVVSSEPMCACCGSEWLVKGPSELKAWSTAMAQPVETTTILNTQSSRMLLEMNILESIDGQTDGQIDRQTDRQTAATKRIISPASLSIISTLLGSTRRLKILFCLLHVNTQFGNLWTFAILVDNQDAAWFIPVELSPQTRQNTSNLQAIATRLTQLSGQQSMQNSSDMSSEIQKCLTKSHS